MDQRSDRNNSSQKRYYTEEELDVLRARRRARQRARERERRRRKMLLIRLGVSLLALLVIGGGVFVFSKMDRTPPTGVAVSLSMNMGEQSPAAEDFVTDLADDGGGAVSVAFVREPDLTKEGTQNVSLLLKDEHGNKTELNSTLTIIDDRTPPVLTGVKPIEINEGETISYKEGIEISDNIDRAEQLTLTIENGQVDPDTGGVYEVTYVLTDRAGNRTEEKTTVTVISQEAQQIEAQEAELKPEVEKLAKKAVKACKKKGQTDEELLWAMFQYVKHNMEYTNSSKKGQLYYEANRAYTKKKGDCYTYYAMLKTMMEAAGFKTYDLHRINGKTQHFWSMVKLKGEWYHIDSCPRSADHYKYWYCFLRTDEELEAFSKKKAKGYYTFDTTDVPKTPSLNEAKDKLKRDKILKKYLKSIGHTEDEHK